MQVSSTMHKVTGSCQGRSTCVPVSQTATSAQHFQGLGVLLVRSPPQALYPYTQSQISMLAGQGDSSCTQTQLTEVRQLILVLVNNFTGYEYASLRAFLLYGTCIDACKEKVIQLQTTEHQHLARVHNNLFFL